MGTRAMDVTMISTVGPSVYGPTPISVQQHRGLQAPPTIGVRRTECVSEDLPKEALAAPEGDKEVLAMPEGYREVLAAPEGDQEALAVPNKEVLTRPKGDQEVLAVPEGDQEVLAAPEGDQDVRAVPEKEVLSRTPRGRTPAPRRQKVSQASTWHTSTTIDTHRSLAPGAGRLS